MTEENISVLIIDDEPSILQSLQGILTDEGYNVLLAGSGRRGLEIVESRKIDVVVVDSYMPGICGIEVLEKIKEQSPEVNVIVISGHGNEELVAKAIELGASDFMEKPISLEPFLSSVKQAIKRRETNVLRVLPGERITALFFESICLYPETRETVEHLENFCRQRFFKVMIATDWTDIVAIPHFIAIIDPSMVKKREWSILFDYLSQVPDTHERYVLWSKSLQPRIPDNLRTCFKTIATKDELERYILARNKKALKRMTRDQQRDFLDQRRQDVKIILNKRWLQREFLIGKLAKYYNVSPQTIQRDLRTIRY